VATTLPQAIAASRRCYVTESKRDNAQVADPKIETAIRLDKAALQNSGLAKGAQQDGNMLVSPMAGKKGLSDPSVPA
jgi:cysteine desulfurase